MGRCDTCWFRCPCLSELTSRREAKPKSVRERDVSLHCAPECNVTRICLRFSCSETSIVLLIKRVYDITWVLLYVQQIAMRWNDFTKLCYWVWCLILAKSDIMSIYLPMISKYYKPYPSLHKCSKCFTFITSVKNIFLWYFDNIKHAKWVAIFWRKLFA